MPEKEGTICSRNVSLYVPEILGTICAQSYLYSTCSFSLFYFPDVFQSEMWREFSASIPDTVLASKADGTICNYLSGFKRWKLWAVSKGVCHLPANPFQVAVYLQCLMEGASPPSPILNAVYSIDWAQQLAGLPKVPT